MPIVTMIQDAVQQLSLYSLRDFAFLRHISDGSKYSTGGLQASMAEFINGNMRKLAKM
jgi:hypothetical protein